MTARREDGRGARLPWADVARGACIVLVVLNHLLAKHFEPVLATAVGGSLSAVQSLWDAWSSTLKPLRMPLFFTLSGLFAARAVARPWRSVVGPRLVDGYYLYVVWLLVHMAVFSVVTTLQMNRTRDLGELAVDLLYPSTSMWYLYALPVYFVLVKVLRRSTSLLVAVAVGLLPLALVLPIESVNRASGLQNFVYFAAGATWPRAWSAVATDERLPRTAPLLLGYAAAYVALPHLGVPRDLGLALLSVIAVPTALRLAALASRQHVPATILGWLGRRTLPVYVLHVPVLALLHAGPDPLRWAAAHASTRPVLAATLAWTYPVVATVAVVAACLALHQLLRRCGFAWLFQRPPVPWTSRSPARSHEGDSRSARAERPVGVPHLL